MHWRINMSVGRKTHGAWRTPQERPCWAGIVGFELLAASIELKFKLNQNHIRGNVEGAIAGLSTSKTDDSVSIAGLMQEALDRKAGA